MRPARGPQTVFFWHRLLWRHCCATSSGHLNILSRAARKNNLGGFWALAPRLRHLTLSNPGIQAIGSWA